MGELAFLADPAQRACPRAGSPRFPVGQFDHGANYKVESSFTMTRLGLAPSPKVQGDETADLQDRTVFPMAAGYRRQSLCMWTLARRWRAAAFLSSPGLLAARAHLSSFGPPGTTEIREHDGNVLHILLVGHPPLDSESIAGYACLVPDYER